MTSDWRRFCQVTRYEIAGEAVVVRLGARRHRVRIYDDGDDWRLEATVGKRGVELSMRELRLLAWRRNRAVDLVGFRVDDKQRVLGEAWVPKAGTGAPEFRIVLDAVARESDLLEFGLTGRDVE